MKRMINIVICFPSAGRATAITAIPYKTSSSQKITARFAIGLVEGLRIRPPIRLPSRMEIALPRRLIPSQIVGTIVPDMNWVARKPTSQTVPVMIKKI